ncbi:serine protease Do [Rhodoblastus acidophilus]|uniref:Probable periplasmic serine endoprotease DegP-like n=1 Tax=Rhodoblastus acidophilus TaxID=1074 RepID=A0A212RTC6_RHOAC|nr:Do family serine endopeptidase [Rhodoblastus acidophilus]MCW2315450.1 serine protease Do [Rhodoblastus acidophilus]PPQ40708.1 serine protease [Rhodoblastus acidophilus]RAI21914.1 serine protease [Rhodoblastus acidophilus]SNB75782.1 serine protease Do [Rhodoblastus acidophilus]
MKLLAAALAGLLALAAPAFARGAPETFADLADQVTPAVVNISATQVEEKKAEKLPPGGQLDDMFEEFLKRHRQPNGGGPRRSTSLGSGFVIDSAGIVVTNNHVIADANEIEVIFTDGSKLKAELVGKDAKVDVAVLRVKPAKPLASVKFGDSDKARVGDWVMAVGNPFALGGTVTAGIISAKNRDIDSGPYDSFIQTDAAINKGNSGGPLFNMAGEVVGINTAILSPTGGSIGIGFATPAATAQPVIEQLLKFGETRRGWLGVRIQKVDDGIAESLGLGKPRGALISGLDERGPSAKAGFKAGDVIVSFDGKPVPDAHELPKIVAQTPVGKDVDIVVVREGKELTRKVTLGRLDESAIKQAKADDPKPAAPPAGAAVKALGLELAPLDESMRAKFQVKDAVKAGALIVRVTPDSPAAEQKLAPGEIVIEINRTPVARPEDVDAQVKALRAEKKKTALVLIANGQGQARFVALPVD